ncbi:rab5 GDP/GTP exchange factor-like [Xenia sp. Carnegie-2017]|uniref:rab5 GDP/GTP exchange factor-like n=1 Tax=Xenia sp. Carnegie-2017 TaxID=2897299 RepID=UPI001F046FB1|nr:rab5 GDP/GTP exchange factor-like [Xenia sp. Carnegie-2017]
MAARLKATKSKLSERNPQLKCPNECGFYGNPSWQGYCSLCYKAFLANEAAHSSHEKNSSYSRKVNSNFETDQASANEETTLPFSKFEEKKKLQLTSKKQSVRKLFTKTKGDLPVELPIESVSTSMRGDSMDAPAVSNDVFRHTSDFNSFLKTLRKPAAQDIVSKCKFVTEKIMNNDSWSVERQSEFLQNFYIHMEERLQSHSAFRGTTPAQFQTALDGVEKYVMTKIYKIVFCPPSTDDELKDLELQKKIRSLKWVTQQHLDAAVNLQNKKVVEFLEDAQNDIAEVNMKRAPQDKLSCIVRCSKRVFHMIRLSSPEGNPGSADDFLPCLIYLLLKCTPTLLHSNIQYITRFCNANKLISGEAGYYFTNLCCAVKFIEMIDAKSLSLTEEEFNRYMNGEKIGNALDDQQMANKPVCEGLQLMQKNLEDLAELRERQLKWRQKATQLQNDVHTFRINVEKEVAGILDGTISGQLKYCQQYRNINP